MIIPALNEEKYILNALQGLRSQSFKNFEIIVADGGSSDKTREMAKKYAKVVVEKRRGIAAGRNAGAKVAKGEILVFLDADTKPTKRLLEIYSNAINKKVIAATGPIYPLEKVNTRTEIGYRFVSIFFVRISILIGQPSVVGSNFAVRKDMFKRVHGFDSNLMTYEDYDLSRKLEKHGKIAYINEAYVNTSARRIKAWGVFGFFAFHVENMFRYYLIRKPKTVYPEIR